MLKLQKRNPILSIRFIAVLFCLLYLGHGHLFALERSEDKGKDSIKKIDLVIQYKTKKRIISRDKVFMVSGSIPVFTSQGRKMTLYSLPVPCKATVEYKPTAGGNPNAVKIVLRQKFSGAKTGWSAPKPE